MQIDNNPNHIQDNDINIIHLQMQINAMQRRRRILLFGFFGLAIMYMILRFDEFTHVQPLPTRNNQTQQQPINTTHHQSNMTVAMLALVGQHFRGEWQYDSSSVGKVSLQFLEPISSKESYKMFIDLYQGWQLEDDQTAFLYYLNESGFSYEQVGELLKVDFKGINATGQEYSVYNKQIDHQCVCDLQLVISGLNMETGELADKSTIHVFSRNECGSWTFQYDADLKPSTQNFETHALLYSFVISVVAFLQVVACLKILRDILMDERQSSQYSMITIVLITTYDGYLSVVHFSFAMLSDYFITPSFLFFILFSFLEMRLIIQIWKDRYSNIVDNMAVRRELFKFYFKFYTFMIILIILLYKFIFYNTFLILLNLYLIPQIVHVAIRGQQVEFDKVFIFGLLASRIIVPLYFRGCPSNFLEMTTSYTTCMCIILVNIAQIYIYYIQCEYGPRYIVPYFMRPKTHQYFMEITDIDVECAVCMGSVKEPPTENPEKTQNKLIDKVVEREQNKIMATPCNHYFHVTCLTRWMAVKMNCPTCRQDLPPVI